ncbi:MAG: Lipid A export ATP-binding/permease protein MsbA [Steroidobacteraceae bacterium]|nr:Lipid A export ATP-binding/permease protein MsbA [Steroidobacteraceae bacterium]
MSVPVVPPVVTNPGQVYRRLLGYARPYIGTFLVGVVGMALFASTDALLAYLVKIFLGGAFVEHDPRVIWIVPLGAVVLFFLRGIGDYVSNYFPASVGRRIIKALRGELFAKYLRLPVAWFDATSTAEMLSRLTYNIEQVAEATTNAVTVLIRDTLTIVVLLGYLFWLNWQLAAFALVLAPLISWLIRRINSSFRRYSTRIQNSMADVTRVAKETLDAQRVVRVFNAQRRQEEAFERANELNRHSNMRLVNARAMSNPVVQFIASIGLAGVLYFAISQVQTRAMRVDEFMSFLTALLLVTAPLRRLVNVFGPLQQGIAAGASVFAVLDSGNEDEGGARTVGRARGDIEYRGVSFAYRADKGQVLRGIDLTVAAGRTLAIVGRSGSGKSTLVALLPRFYDPQQGVVRLDGADLREYRLANLRDQVAVVSQDIVLFDDTIRANVAFGRPDAGAEAIEAAAEAAYVMDFARELPQGLDTHVGDRGALLSGGQRQRISIARAILKDAPVLVLDEATSALDSESERHIQAALTRLQKGRTTLVIAHRLSTVEQADDIIVMDEGAIVEHGTHADLLARGGAYAQLHRMQFNA